MDTVVKIGRAISFTGLFGGLFVNAVCVWFEQPASTVNSPFFSNEWRNGEREKEKGNYEEYLIPRPHKIDAPSQSRM